MKLQTSNLQPVAARPRPFGAWSLVLLWSLVLGAWNFHAHAADTNAVLNSWFASQTNLQTWSADFTQTRTLKTLTQPLVAVGRISFAAPNQFRWELGQPARTIALRQAEEMWVIYPRLKRAERYPMGNSSPGEWRDMLSLLDAGFPRDRAAFDARFRILSLTETDGAWLLALQPVSAFAQKMMKEIRVGMATNDFALTSNELIFIDGSSMRNDFTNALSNPMLSKDVFFWKPEAGYKITEPMSGR